MHTFLQRFAGAVSGVLHGFDRVRFRGTKRLLMHVGGLLSYLWQRQVKRKDFAQHAQAAELTQPLTQAVTWKGQRTRGLQPLAEPDARLLAAVNRGAFLRNGFRNRDLRPWLYEVAAVTPAEGRRQSAAVTRQLRRLRAHGLMQKVSKTHHYLVTDKGRTLIAALLAARAANTTKLLDAA